MTFTPTTAGRMLRPYLDKDNPPVVIDRELCTGCKLCIHACPQSVLKSVPDASRIEGVVAVVFNPSLCTACRQCEDVCPRFLYHSHCQGGNKWMRFVGIPAPGKGR